MRRRLDLAAALVARPPVLFLDEPTTGLDLRSRIGLWDAMEELVSGGTTVLLTTQQLDEADRLADRIAVVDQGLVIAEGTSDDLKNQVGGDKLEIRLDDRDRGEAALVAALGARRRRGPSSRTASCASRSLTGGERSQRPCAGSTRPASASRTSPSAGRRSTTSSSS